MGELNPLNIEKRDLIHQTETEDNFTVGHPNVVSLGVRNAYRKHTLPSVTMEVGVPVAVSMHKRNLFNYETGPVETFNLNVPIAVSANRVNKLKKLSTYPLDEVLLLNSPVVTTIWSTCKPVLSAPAYLHAKVDGDAIKLSWFNTSITMKEQNIYISTSPFIDGGVLPTPIVVSSNARSYNITEYPITQAKLYIIVSTMAITELLSEVYTYTLEQGSSGDPYWDNVVALLHFDGDLTDETGASWSAVGSHSFASGRFDDAAMLPGLNYNYFIAAASTKYDLPGDFTIEAFIKPSSLTGYAIYLSRQNDSGGNLALQMRLNNGVPEIVMRAVGTGVVTLSSAGGAITTNTFTHIAAVRENGYVLLFVNGVIQAAGACNFDLTHAGGARHLLIGGADGNSPGSVYSYHGAIDELRITKGVARYTENFTPPTEPFPNGS